MKDDELVAYDIKQYLGAVRSGNRFTTKTALFAYLMMGFMLGFASGSVGVYQEDYVRNCRKNQSAVNSLLHILQNGGVTIGPEPAREP